MKAEKIFFVVVILLLPALGIAGDTTLWQVLGQFQDLSWLMELDSLVSYPMETVRLESPLPNGQIFPGDSCVFTGESDADDTLQAFFIMYIHEGGKSIYLNDSFWIPEVKLEKPLAIIPAKNYITGQFYWPGNAGKRYLVVVRLGGGGPYLVGGPWELNYFPNCTADVQLIGKRFVKNKFLFLNFPNPFNPVTTIRYSLPTDGDVRLTVFDMLGKEVAVLANGFQTAGEHQVRWDATNFPSGTYFSCLKSGGSVQIQRMTLLK